MKTLDFIFDFGSPNAYFAYHALVPILERTGAQLNLIPCLLGGIFKATGNTPPMMAFGGVKGKMEYEQLEMQRFMEKHDLNAFKFNPHFPVNTLLLARAAVAMAGDARFQDFLKVGLVAMWEEEKKMDDPDVFAAVFAAAGFDGAALVAKTQDPVIKQQLIENTEAAVERGSFGIPTFYVGSEMFFGKDRLQQVEEALTT